jgi:hypothetical protein
MIWVGPTEKQRYHQQTEDRRSTPVPTKKPDNNPLRSAAEINLLNASITMTNIKRDKWSPCLKPRELLKKPIGELFTKTEKHTEKIQ